MMNRPIPATWAPGAIVPGTVYRIIRPLGSGGMGDVYEAEHELLGVRRAVKVLSRRLAGRGDLAERLRVEARALAGLRHPNLVEVNDLGVSSDGRLFFAMELLVGSTLRDRLMEGGPLKMEQAISVACQVLDALGAAHERAMIHRDVKPENIFLLQAGGVKLLDFGVAKALSAAATPQQLTEAGMAIGTPRYMAPEQAQGLPLDARADLYAVGIVLWEMLSGRPPNSQLDGVAAAVASVTRDVPRLDTEVQGLPQSFVDAIARATARDPEARFETAAQMAAELRLVRPSMIPSPSLSPSSQALNDRVTVRYEQNATSLVPLPSSELLATSREDSDPTDVDRRSSESFAPTELSGGQTSPAVSISSDLRNLPTPTAVPTVSNVGPGTEGRSSTTPAAPPLTPPSRAVLLLGVPAAIALVAGLVLVLRPSRPADPPAASAPAAAETARPTTVAAPSSSAATSPPASASADVSASAAPAASAAPTASSKRDTRSSPKAPPTPARGKPSQPAGMPGSGL